MFKRFATAALAVTALLVTSACSGTSSRGNNDGALSAIGAGISGPAGTSATIVATGLKNVSGLAIDSEGRTWAVTAAFTDTGTDGLYLLRENGAAPLSVVSGLHTPLGMLWIGDQLYLSSAEGVLRFSGFDGTKFETEETIASFSGAGTMGGLVLGADGRIRLGISAPCDDCDPDSQWAATIVSFLPDGTDARVEASGIRAPVGLTYVPGTQKLLVTMNQPDDLGEATPGDYLAVVEPGQDWGFPQCHGQGGASCSGVPSPVAVLDQHAAVSGVAVLAANGQPTAYVAEWSAGKVLEVPLTTAGNGYAGKPETFLTGITGPVALIATPDGSLLVGDWVTGAVYRIALS